MNYSKFGKTSPFRAPLRKDDIGVSRSGVMTEEEILNEADRIGASVLTKSQNKEDSCLQMIPEQNSKKSAEESREEVEVDEKRNQHIAELVEELNFNRTRYEKLLSDHAEEKRYWMNYIKQLEAERDRLYNK
jgi:hypothetical protein